jgi:5-methylcytosine-specific restriction endonuclease McrA
VNTHPQLRDAIKELGRFEKECKKNFQKIKKEHKQKVKNEEATNDITTQESRMEEIQSDTEISSMSSTSDVNNHDDDTSDENNEPTRKNYFEEEDTKYTLKKKRKFEFSEKQKKIIVERQKNKCNNSPGSDFERIYGYACLLHQNGRDGTFEEKVGYEIDHITPISNGGGNNLKNGQALCKFCHSVKTKEENKKYL